MRSFFHNKKKQKDRLVLHQTLSCNLCMRSKVYKKEGKGMSLHCTCLTVISRVADKLVITTDMLEMGIQRCTDLHSIYQPCSHLVLRSSGESSGIHHIKIKQ